MDIRGYITKTLNGMAYGLFASLIIGLILKQIGVYLNIDAFVLFGNIAQRMMGPAIGAAVAYSVNASPLGIFASMVAGAIGAGSLQMNDQNLFIAGIGEPVGSFIAALGAAEFSKLVVGRTKVDIVLVPALTIIVGGFIGVFVSPVMSQFMTHLGGFINKATELQPIPMGIVVAVCMGMILTLPISSAALAISLKLSGLAAGASLVGCSVQMIGFAVISYRENGFGGFLAQGLGTSMLQVPNIIKNPLIWIPPILASAILGPIATYFFKMESNFIGAGMGTSGLVGQFGTIAVMADKVSALRLYSSIGLLHFLLPAVITLIISEYMRKKGWIKYGDMALEDSKK